MDGELWDIKRFDEQLLHFFSCELAGEDRLMGLLDLPGDHVLQGSTLQIELWHKSGSDRGVTQLILPTDLQYHVYCKLPVISICTTQEGEKDALSVAVPGPSADVWGHNVLHFLGQSPEDAELAKTMLGSMNEVMFDLYVKVELEVALETEFHQQLQVLHILSLQTMLPGPHEQQSFSCCQPP